MKHDPTFWLLARASGMVAYALLTATLVAGLTLKTRVLRKVRPASITDVHRFLSLTGLVAVAVHAAALVLDTSIKVSLPALFVPGLVPYRTLWTSLGVVTLELMFILHVSFRLRKLIGNRVWRRLHYASFVAFAGATTHGLLSGSDSGHLWALALYAVSVALIVSLTTWRIDSARSARRAKATLVTPEPKAAERELSAPEEEFDVDLVDVVARLSPEQLHRLRIELGIYDGDTSQAESQPPQLHVAR
jgi:DMSO/TMAO reductase YedYZ heme-binding membrane subunit